MKNTLRNLSRGVIAGIGATVVPFIAYAQDAQSVIGTFQNILSMVVPLIMAIALVYFLWSLVDYLLVGSSKKEEARTHMIQSVVILTVMVSVWGIVRAVQTTVGVQSNATITTPQIPR